MPGLAAIVALDVPPETGVYAVHAAPEEAERNEILEFEEGHCGHVSR